MPVRADAAAPKPQWSSAARIAMVVWSGCLASVLAINFSLFAFAHPQADDFHRASKARDDGVVRSVSDEWHGWSGRWSSTGTAYVISSIVDLRDHYGVFLAAINMVYLIAIYRLLRSLFLDRIGRLAAALWTSVLWSLYWSGAPAIGETCYWLPGALENHLSLALSMLLLAQLLKFRASGWRAWGMASLIAVEGFVIAGMHELYSMVLGLVLLSGAAVEWRLKTANRWVWSVALVAVAVGFAVVFAAPGNANRGAHFPDRGQVALTILLTRQQLANYLPHWIFDPNLLAATALLACYPRLGRFCPDWMRADRTWLVAIVAAVWSAAFCGVFAGVAWATGAPAGGRTANVAYMLFLLGWFLLTLIAAVRLRGDRAASQAVSPVAWFVLLAGLGVSLVATGRAIEALADVLELAPQFDRELQARYAEIERQRGQGLQDIRVPELHSRPKSFFTDNDITADPDDWRNDVQERYWQVESVATVPDP